VKVTTNDTRPWLSDDDSPRCKDGVTYTGHLRATGPDQPGILQSLTAMLQECELDITSLECKQHIAIAGSEHKPQQQFQIEGALRAFTAIDRVKLDKKLADFEKTVPGFRLGITETDPDPSFSAFVNHGNAPSAGSRLARSVTGKFMSGSKPPTS